MSGLASALKRGVSLSAVFFLFTSTSALAATVISSYKGSVQLMRAGAGWKALDTAPFELKDGDHLRTGPASQCVLLFEDGSKVELGAKADFTMDAAGAGGEQVSQNLGTLKAWVEKAKVREFKVRTPSAVAAVRGTEFLVDVRSDGRTAIELYRGLLGITDNRGNELLLHDGQRLEADPSQMGAPQSIQDHKQTLRDQDRQIFRNEVRLDATKDEVLTAASKELKLAEYQQGKALIDVSGNRVRLEQYILRPQPDQFKLVVLNERESRFDYFFYQGTFNRTLPTDLSIPLHQIGGCVGAPCDYFLTSYATGRSNLTDKLAEIALGGHQVDVNHNGVASDGVTEFFDPAKDAYVDVTGQPVYKTLFDQYGLYANNVLKWGWSGTNLQTYSNNPLTLNADPISGAALSSTLNQPSLTTTPGANDVVDVTDPVHQTINQTYSDGSGNTTFLKFSNFILDDNGRVPSWGVFQGAQTGSQFNQALLNYNYEQIITASEFQGRSIDLVVAPKILIQAGLIQ